MNKKFLKLSYTNNAFRLWKGITIFIENTKMFE